MQGLFCFAVPKNRPAVLPIPDSRFRIPENRSLTRKEILKNLLPPLPLPRGIFQNVPDAPCLRLCPHVCATRSGIGQGARLQAGPRSGSRSWPALHRFFSPKCWPGKFWGNFTTRTALLLLITARSPCPSHTHHRLRPGAGQRHCLCRQPSPGSAAPPHPRVSLTLAPPRPTLRAGPLGRSLAESRVLRGRRAC